MMSHSTPLPVRRLYVHIPFCTGKCAYCDFFSIPVRTVDSSALSAYVDAIARQAEHWLPIFNAGHFQSIYIGGGTPTALGSVLLERLLRQLEPYASEPCEWTIEANPESLTERVLDLLGTTRVNRISLGIQTLSDHEWPTLGRVGSVRASREALKRLARHGANWRLSADFLAGIPLHDDADNNGDELLSSLAQVTELVSHLSVYDLTIEEGTPLAQRIREKEVQAVGEERLAAIRNQVDSFLSAKGFVRYEISNYARPGHESSHNMGYWNYEPYLGLGAGAVSSVMYVPYEVNASSSSPPLNFVLRIQNPADLQHYLNDPVSIPHDSPAAERIERPMASFEFMMMGFRMRKGIDLARFSHLFCHTIEETIPKTLERWKSHLIIKDNRLALEPGCLDILNRFLVDCLEEMDYSGRP